MTNTLFKIIHIFCDIFCRNSRKILFNKLYQVVLRFSWQWQWLAQLSGSWNKQMHSAVSSFKNESGPVSPNKKKHKQVKAPNHFRFYLSLNRCTSLFYILNKTYCL